MVSGVSAGVVLVGGSTVWLLERGVPGGTFGSWGDSLWWALTTITTTGYGDHVPITLAGRLVGVVVMMAGVSCIRAVRVRSIRRCHQTSLGPDPGRLINIPYGGI